MEPNLGLEGTSGKEVIDTLNTVLADELLMYMKLRNYHWNVKGPQFMSLHELYEKQYARLESLIDGLAERIASYGGTALGTFKGALSSTRLTEGTESDATKMCQDLLKSHELMVRNLRSDAEKCGEELEDIGSEDLLTGLLQEHQEMAWMIRTFLEGKPVAH